MVKPTFSHVGKPGLKWWPARTACVSFTSSQHVAGIIPALNARRASSSESATLHEQHPSGRPTRTLTMFRSVSRRDDLRPKTHKIPEVTHRRTIEAAPGHRRQGGIYTPLKHRRRGSLHSRDPTDRNDRLDARDGRSEPLPC